MPPAQTLFNDFSTSLDAFRTSATSYVIALSAVGVTAMALVQTIKQQTPIRAFYQRRRIRKWIREGFADFQKGQATIPDGVRITMDGLDPVTAETDILNLATDGDSKAFYGLEIEKLCGQLNAASQSILQYPNSHLSALAVLASEANPDDLATFKTGITGPLSVPPTPQQAAYIAARAQVTQQVQRAIDALQISVGADWQTHLQQASLLLSVLTFEVLLLRSQTLSKDLGLLWPLWGLFLGILSGFLAPVSRDIVAAIENLRA
jgi:hypothetical protein